MSRQDIYELSRYEKYYTDTPIKLTNGISNTLINFLNVSVNT